jgi:hypothetical protein
MGVLVGGVTKIEIMALSAAPQLLEDPDLGDFKNLANAVF